MYTYNSEHRSLHKSTLDGHCCWQSLALKAFIALICLLRLNQAELIFFHNKLPSHLTMPNYADFITQIGILSMMFLRTTNLYTFGVFVSGQIVCLTFNVSTLNTFIKEINITINIVYAHTECVRQ